MVEIEFIFLNTSSLFVFALLAIQRVAVFRFDVM